MLIILDLDGTILDSQTQHLNAFIKAIKKTGDYAGKELIEKIKAGFGKPGYEILREVLPDKNEIIIKTIQKSAQYILMNEEFEKVRLLPFTLSFLKNNKAEHEFALASSSSKEFAEKILEKYDIKKYFKVVLAREDVKNPKPDPEVLLKALELTGYKKSDAVFIGDTLHDYECARNAEVKFIGLTGDSLFAKELKQKAQTYKNLEEVEL